MFVKLLIVTLGLVAFIVLALGVKLWFDPDAEFSSHSCALESGDLDETGACSKCQVKELPKYPDSKNLSALEILKERYARGEIEKEEFEEKKSHLNS